jgi:hypothetical protein
MTTTARQAQVTGTRWCGWPPPVLPREILALANEAGGESVEIGFRVLDVPTGWNAGEIRAGIRFCLDAVSAIIDVIFTEVATDETLTFSFTGMQAGPPPVPVPAWATGFYTNGVITYQPFLTYSTASPLPPNAVDFISVTLHELGHFLGLGHTADPDAAMYVGGGDQRAYGFDDIAQMQRLWGGKIFAAGNPVGAVSAGVDVAAVDLSGTGRTDLVVAYVDDLDGPNTVSYRIGRNVDATGAAAAWGPLIPIGQGPIGSSVHGLGIATGQATGGPRPDLVVVWADAPEGENMLFYRVGRDLDADGVAASWTTNTGIDGWIGSETDGVAAALFDIDGDGLDELVVAWIDDPDGENAIYYRIGRNFVNAVVQQWDKRRFRVPGPVGSSSSGLGISITDRNGNGRPDLVLSWVDDLDQDNQGYLQIGYDLLPSGEPLAGWSDRMQVFGWHGHNTVDAGAALVNVRGFGRPDLVQLHLDDRDGDQAFYRLLSPPVPAWHGVRGLAGRGRPAPGLVERLAAVAPMPDLESGGGIPDWADVMVVGLGMRTALVSSNGVIPVVWDKTDLDENLGSDMFDFVPGTITKPDRRPGSPVAAVSRQPDSVELFWIDTANRVSTSQARVGATGSTAPPSWTAARSLNPGPVARAPSVLVPGSPLAAASIDPDHVAFFVVDVKNSIAAQHWTKDGGWGPEQPLTGPWPEPVTQLTAVARQRRFLDVFWNDGRGGIWAATAFRNGSWREPRLIFDPKSPIARLDSPLAAVARRDDVVDLFWIRPGDEVVSSFCLGTQPASDPAPWAEPFPISGGLRAEPNSGLAAVHGWQQRLHVFWEGRSARIGSRLVSAWWAPRQDNKPVPWARPVALSMPGALERGTDIAAVSRAPGLVRAFFIRPDGTAGQIWWGATP